MRILVVADEPAVARLIKKTLNILALGRLPGTGNLSYFSNQTAIVDVMLPGVNVP